MNIQKLYKFKTMYLLLSVLIIVLLIVSPSNTAYSSDLFLHDDTKSIGSEIKATDAIPSHFNSQVVSNNEAYLTLNSQGVSYSKDGISWQNIDTKIPEASNIVGFLTSILFDGKNFALLTTSGDVWLSTDGLNWHAAIKNTYQKIHDGFNYFCWDGKEIYTITSVGKIYISKDEKSWIYRGQISESTLHVPNITTKNIVYNGSIYATYIDTHEGPVGIVLISHDGLNWKEVKKVFGTNEYNSPYMTTMNGNIYLYAIDGRFAYSKNGVNWVIGTVGSYSSLSNIMKFKNRYIILGAAVFVSSPINNEKVGPEKCKFYKLNINNNQNLLCSNGIINKDKIIVLFINGSIATTLDSINWDFMDTLRLRVDGAIDINGNFIISGTESKDFYWHVQDYGLQSKDGITWSPAALPKKDTFYANEYYIPSLIKTNLGYLFVGTNKKSYYTSKNGVKWATHYAPFKIGSKIPNYYLSGNKILIPESCSKFLICDDGINFHEESMIWGNPNVSVNYLAGDGSKTIAAMYDSKSQTSKLYLTTDLKKWTCEKELPTGTNITRVAYINSRYFAYGFLGAPHTYLNPKKHSYVTFTSRDGIHWVKTNSFFNYRCKRYKDYFIPGITYTVNNKLFSVITSDDYTHNIIIWSSDGVNWNTSEIKTAFSSESLSIVYNGSKYIIFPSDIEPNGIWISSDGYKWDQQEFWKFSKLRIEEKS